MYASKKNVWSDVRNMAQIPHVWCPQNEWSGDWVAIVYESIYIYDLGQYWSVHDDSGVSSIALLCCCRSTFKSLWTELYWCKSFILPAITSTTYYVVERIGGYWFYLVRHPLIIPTIYSRGQSNTWKSYIGWFEMEYYLKHPKFMIFFRVDRRSVFSRNSYLNVSNKILSEITFRMVFNRPWFPPLTGWRVNPPTALPSSRFPWGIAALGTAGYGGAGNSTQSSLCH